MSKRDFQKTQTKANLTKTAYETFAEKGIMNTRISDIAQAAGVSHGTVFIHFPSQEALIEEVISVYGQKIAIRTHETMERCENLESFLWAHLEAISEFEAFYTRLVIENRMLPPGARDSFIALQSAISFHFSNVMQSGPENMTDVPCYLLFNTWMGLVHYYLANGDLFAPEGNVLRRHGETLIHCFMNLVSGKEEL